MNSSFEKAFFQFIYFSYYTTCFNNLYSKLDTYVTLDYIFPSDAIYYTAYTSRLIFKKNINIFLHE